MIESGDDDDLRMFAALRALRRHVVRVSEDFGARLSVRLLALAAARDKGDPSLLTIFASVMSEAVTLMTEPLTPRLPEGTPEKSAPGGPEAAVVASEPKPAEREQLRERKKDDDDA